jgi:hypothetical protein
MKQVSIDVASAFMQGRAKKSGNTQTDGKSLWLHGNKIAEHREDGLYITHCGWQTKTTKDRLNALSGVRIYQKNFKWYLNGEEWNGEWKKVNENAPPVVDEKKVGTLFDTTQRWVASDGWRGYNEPIYAVCGANDTGMWSDSPCPSDVCERELNGAIEVLKSLKIPTKVITCESSNVFCVHRYVIVPPKYFEEAKLIVREYIDNTENRLIYAA